jgi:hypothetical protein
MFITASASTAIQVLVKLVELLVRDNGCLARETWKEDGIKDKEQWSRSIHSAVQKTQTQILTQSYM